MPAKNRIKKYLSGGVYHIYNRGLEGMEVFRDEQDYQMFVRIMRRYLEEVEIKEKPGFKLGRPYLLRRRQQMSLVGEVGLMAYCLMPDHFHLLLQQEGQEGMVKFMRRVGTNYGMYYNRKYKRQGPVWENVYRAKMVGEEREKLLHVTRYIHLNPVVRKVARFGPVETVTVSKPEEYSYSSYRCYLGLERDKWVSPVVSGEEIDKYRKWVEDPKIDSEKFLGDLILESKKG